MIAIYLNTGSAGEYDSIHAWTQLHGLDIQTFNIDFNADAKAVATRCELNVFPVMLNETFNNKGESQVIKYAEGAGVIPTLGDDVVATLKTALAVTVEVPVQTTGPAKA